MNKEVEKKMQERKDTHMVNLVWRMEFLLTECSYVMLEESVKTYFGMGTVYFLFSEKILAV